MKQTKYQHLITWCVMMGSYQYYIDLQIAKAEELNAPENTIYFSGNTPVTFNEVSNGSTIRYFHERGLK